MQAVTLDQQIVQKISQLNPMYRQNVYEFIEFLLSKQIQESDVRQSALLNISVWDEQAIQAIEATQQQVNAWQLPTF